MGNKTPTNCLWGLYGYLEVIRSATRITCYGDRACLEDKMNESRGFLRNPTYLAGLVYTLSSGERLRLGSPEPVLSL